MVRIHHIHKNRGGAIRCLSMMTQAELQRLRGLLDDARVALDGIASMSRDGSKGRVRAAHAKITLGMMAGIAEDTIAKLKK